MIGAIIGDIVGSIYEFDNTEEYNFNLFTNHSSYTDDTICTIAVADAILSDTSYKDSILKWCRKYPNPKGAYGGSFSNWIESANPLPYNSYGNGSAMRVSPIGWAFNCESDIIRNAMESAKCSHSHTEGIIGAIAVAMAIYQLRKNRAYNLDSLASYYYGSDWNKNLPRKGFFDVSCQGCVPLAFNIIEQSSDFEDAIRLAIAYGGDSDTLGAIVGSIAQAKFGVPHNIIDKAISYLPNDMKEVLKKFNSQFNL